MNFGGLNAKNFPFILGKKSLVFINNSFIFILLNINLANFIISAGQKQKDSTDSIEHF